MYAQLDLEVIYKRLKKEGRPPSFHEFWSKRVHCKIYPKNKTLIFER
jgi:hypothetical protein